MKTRRLYRRDREDKINSLNRVVADAKQGRAALALERIADLLDEFPDDASVLYEKGLLLRDNLGAGIEARACFERAYHAAAPGEEVRGLASCNAMSLAADEAEADKWFAVAADLRPSDEMLASVRKMRSAAARDGVDFDVILRGRVAAQAEQGPEHGGGCASLIEIFLSCAPLRADEERAFRIQRALCLRALDFQASRTREMLAEDFPPEERIALQRALPEMERACEIDPHDAELWNFRAAWCTLLRRDEEAIAHADKAITLRPHRYAKPWLNKANACWRLGRTEEARRHGKTALEQATAAGDERDCSLARSIDLRSGNASDLPADDAIAEWQAQFNKGWLLTAKKEVSKKGGSGGFEQIAGGFLKRIGLVGSEWHPDIIKIVAEMLIYFSPETSLAALNEAREQNRRAYENALNSALYLAATQKGVLGRDAVRMIALGILATDSPASSKALYRACVIQTSAASKAFSSLPEIMGRAISAINPSVARWIKHQPPADQDDIERARTSILWRFEAGKMDAAGRPVASAGARAGASLAILVGLVVLGWTYWGQISAFAARNQSLLITIVGTLVFLPLIVMQVRSAAAALARRSTCGTCGCPLEKIPVPAYMHGMGGVMMNTSRMHAGIDGIGAECTACGQLYCPRCEDPTQPCKCGAPAIRRVGVTRRRVG